MGREGYLLCLLERYVLNRYEIMCIQLIILTLRLTREGTGNGLLIESMKTSQQRLYRISHCET